MTEEMLSHFDRVGINLRRVLGSTGIPACASSGYLRYVGKTRKRKNALFDLACLVRACAAFLRRHRQECLCY